MRLRALSCTRLKQPLASESVAHQSGFGRVSVGFGVSDSKSTVEMRRSSAIEKMSAYAFTVFGLGFDFPDTWLRTVVLSTLTFSASVSSDHPHSLRSLSTFRPKAPRPTPASVEMAGTAGSLGLTSA